MTHSSAPIEVFESTTSADAIVTSVDASGTELLVRQLLDTVTNLTLDLPPVRADQIRAVSEMLAVSALHAQTARDEAVDALSRSSRPFELDALTGLPNRVLFRDRFSQALAHAKRRGGRVALLFVDLNGFKAINDTFGHAIGDELIRHVARCLSASGRDVDTVCRHGGDEFLVLLSDITSYGNAATYAEKALALLSEPVRVGEEVMRVGASVGISVYPDDGDDQETLIRQADTAMYQAKRTHSNYVFASPSRMQPTPEASRLQHASTNPERLLETALNDARRTVADLTAVNERLVRAVSQIDNQRQVAESSARQQADLLNVVAHELRNSLSPLQSVTHMLAMVGADVSLMPRIEMILRRQVDHITRLLTDLLEVSRLNHGRLSIEAQRVDFVSLAAEVAASVRDVVEGRNQSLISSLTMESGFVTGDRARLWHLLEILLGSASQMSPDGHVLHLGLKLDGEHLRLVLAAASELTRSVDFVDECGALTDVSSIVPIGDGTGLSLLVVSELARSHGGTLRARQGNGTSGWTFCLSLPAVQ